MSAPNRIVACPRCGKPVEWKPENRFRPFCSERCRTIDLGAWASERYRVPAEDAAPDDARTEGDSAREAGRRDEADRRRG